MFSNTALDVFIGLIFVILLYSLLATIIQELIAVRFAFRPKILERAVLRMLEDGKTTSHSNLRDRAEGFLFLFLKPNQLKGKAVAPWFYAHPLIKYFGENNYYSKPAYLSSENFSKILLDLLKGTDSTEGTELQRLNHSITNGTIYKLPVNLHSDPENSAIAAILQQNQCGNHPLTVKINQDTTLFLQTLWQDAGSDPDKLKLKLEQWYDDTMERASGWYKRYTQTVLLIIGFAIAVIFNVDTIAIHRILSKDKVAREQLVQMASSTMAKNGAIVQNMPTSDSVLTKTYNLVLQDANDATQILGLGKPWKDSCNVCEESFHKYDEPKAQFLATKNSLVAKLAILNNWSQQSLTHKKKLDSLSSLSFGPGDSIKAKANKTEIVKYKTLKASADESFAKYNYKAVSDSVNKLAVLANRCPVIMKESETLFKYSPNQAGGFETFFGWILTGLAISLGAPFWFDLLNKLVKLRGSGTKISPTDTGDAGTAKNTNTTPGTSAPVTVTINPNAGEEAVG